MKNLLKFTDDFENHEEIILRDFLALQRTKLANERTLFAYLRTSLYLLTAGIGILEIESIEHLKIIAYISLTCSVILFLVGVIKFIQLKKQLKDYAPQKSSPR